MEREYSERLFSVDAYNTTPAVVAHMFAESFPEPRKVDYIETYSDKEFAEFMLVDGSRVYRIFFVKSDGKTYPDHFEVKAVIK